MSNNIFAKNKYNKIFQNLNLDSESSNILPNSINIVDLNSSDNSSILSQSGGSTTSEFNPNFIQENEAYLSATSSNTSMFMAQNGGSLGTNGEMTSSFMPQNGGYLSATSSNTSMFMAQNGGSLGTNGEMTSSFMPQNGGYLSATSSNTSMFMAQNGGSFGTNGEMTSSFMPQKGGSFSATSDNKNNNNDVNQLISMLTSDSNDKNIFTANSTATEELENRLRNMLQDGGAKKKKNKKY